MLLPMRLLLLVALSGVAACGGATSELADQGGAAAQATTASSPESWPAISDKEVRSGCLSFTQTVHEQDSNEVYDPASGVLQVYVGQQRFLLSKAVQECRDNSVAMERLRFAEMTEESNRS